MGQKAKYSLGADVFRSSPQQRTQSDDGGMSVSCQEQTCTADAVPAIARCGGCQAAAVLRALHRYLHAGLFGYCWHNPTFPPVPGYTPLEHAPMHCCTFCWTI